MFRWTPNQVDDDGLPPEAVRFVELRPEPWPDQIRRVRIHLEITPFLQRPNIEATISNLDGVSVSVVHVIDIIDSHMTFTMHIKDETIKNPYTLKASLYYPEDGTVDEKSVSFDLLESDR